MKEDVTIAKVAIEHRRRVEREERDWLLARIHFAAHGSWFEDACAVCDMEADQRAEEVELLREGAPEFNGAYR